MDETRYRESRLCRILGNPVAYSLVVQLSESGPQSPSELAAGLGRTVYAISHILAKLRMAELVRFDRAGRGAQYRIKYPRQTSDLMRALGLFERATREEK
jgi:predicted transcriptional regulator